MKAITKIFAISFFLFATVLTANAQSNIVWEDGGEGSNYVLNQFENGPYPQDAANLSRTDNPNASGINTTAKCIRMNILDAGQNWAGFWFVTNSSNDNSTPITISNSNCIIKAMVYKPVSTNITFKLEDFSDGGKNKEIHLTNQRINEWEEMTFDFSSEIGKTYHKIVIMLDNQDGRNADRVCYVDQISFNSNTTTGLKSAKSLGFTMFLNANQQLQLSSSKGIQHVTIRSINGQNLKTAAINGMSGSIDMSELSAANYLVSAKLFDGQVSTQKVVKF